MPDSRTATASRRRRTGRGPGSTCYADPRHTEPGQINRLFGGRGAYFDDPSGHNMEIMTVPYVRP
ncbi:hypothetical protein QF037_008993 [Streptomyces canus]|nr:hypothetical protein [Streptomyces canus]